jgi:hypothetical protein
MSAATAVTVQPELGHVEQRLAEVSASLNQATGGQALCRIDGTGGTAKSFEGRMAVLLEVRRLLRRDPGADLAPVLDRWRADLGTRTERGSSPAWLDYLAGGVSELEHLTGATAPPADEGDFT